MLAGMWSQRVAVSVSSPLLGGYGAPESLSYQITLNGPLALT